ADVVDGALRAVTVMPARERDLELARQVLADRIAQEMARHRLRVGRDVERLAGRNAGVGARGHVSHGVAAGLARGQSDLCEPVLQLRHLAELAEMKLNVLARGDVAEAARVTLGNGPQKLELLGGQDALRDL